MTHQEFKARFLPCHKKMYYIAFRYLGNEYDAEDMVQNTYLKLWEKRESLENIENNEAYAITTIKHLCLDTLRAPQIETDNDSVLVQETEPAPQPDTAYEIKEDMKVLLNIINKLPEQQRKILLLRHFEDKSTDEIETETGLSNANIRVLLSQKGQKTEDCRGRSRSASFYLLYPIVRYIFPIIWKKNYRHT